MTSCPGTPLPLRSAQLGGPSNLPRQGVENLPGGFWGAAPIPLGCSFPLHPDSPEYRSHCRKAGPLQQTIKGFSRWTGKGKQALRLPVERVYRESRFFKKLLFSLHRGWYNGHTFLVRAGPGHVPGKDRRLHEDRQFSGISSQPSTTPPITVETYPGACYGA